MWKPLVVVIFLMVVALWYNTPTIAVVGERKPTNPAINLPEKVEQGAFTTRDVKPQLSSHEPHVSLQVNEHLAPLIRRCETPEYSAEEIHLHQQYVKRLQYSTHVNQQLIYALFSEMEQSEQLAFIASLQPLDASNRMLNFELLNLCIGHKHPQCNDSLIAEVEAVDGDNAAVWLNIASYYLTDNNIALAKTALERLTLATHYQNYIEEQSTLFIELMKSSPINDFAFHFPQTFSIAAAKPFHFNAIVSFCRSSFDDSESTKQLCLEVGRQLETLADDSFVQLMGQQLQKEVYAHEQNSELFNLLEQRIKQVSNNPKLYFSALMLMSHDKALYMDWLAKKRQLGDIEASQWLVKTAIENSANNNYQPCL